MDKKTLIIADLEANLNKLALVGNPVELIPNVARAKAESEIDTPKVNIFELLKLNSPILNVLVANVNESPSVKDSGNITWVRIDPNYGMGKVTSGFSTNYEALSSYSFIQQVWLYDRKDQRNFLTAIQNEVIEASNFLVQIGIIGPSYVNEGSTTLSYTITLSDSIRSNGSIIINFSYAGTATDGSDYSKIEQIIIPCGRNSVTFNLNTFSDNIVEGDEYFIIKIHSITNNTNNFTLILDPSHSEVTTTILDTQTVRASLSGPATVNEGENTGDYTIILSQPVPVGGTVIIHLTYSGIAQDGTDFNGFLSVTIPSGSNSATFHIETFNDLLIEGSESFTVSIDSIDNLNAFPSLGINPFNNSITTTIIDADTALWSISGSDSVNEGDTAEYILSLSGVLQANETARIQLHLNNITTNAQDYSSYINAINLAVNNYSGPGELVWNAINQTLAFTSNGQAMADLPISLLTINDTLVEGTETFQIILNNPGSTTEADIQLNTPQITTSIIDTDNGSALETANWTLTGSSSVNEGQSALYTVNFNGVLQANETSSIHLNLNDITTTAQDYGNFVHAVALAVANYPGPGLFNWDPVTQILTFTSNGQVMGGLNINLPITDDTIIEGTESFQIVLDNPGSSTGANVTGNATLSTNIIDTNNGGPGLDTATWSMTGSTTVNEGDTANYTLSLAGVLQANETASIHLNLNDVSTNVQDHGDFLDAVALAVANYAGSGFLTWDSATQTLTFTSNGQAMDNLNISLSTVDDTAIEGTETFQIIMDNPASTTGANVTGNATLNTDIIDTANGGPTLDTATWTITGTAAVDEGQFANYTLSLSGLLQVNETSSIHLNLADHSTNTLDYTSFIDTVALAVTNYSGSGSLNWDGTTQTLTFTSNGQAMADLLFNLAILDDTLVEGDEVFQIILDNPASTTGAYVIGTDSVTTTITDSNDGSGLDTANWSIIGSNSINEGDTASYTLSLTGVLQANETASIHLNLNDVSTNTQDYGNFLDAVTLAVANYAGPGSLNWDSATQTLTFTSDGQAMGDVNINLPTVDDSLVEGTETFQIILSNPGSSTGANITGNFALNTNIIDTTNGGPDLDRVTWSMTGTSIVNEGQIAQYTINLSGILQADETVNAHLTLSNISTNNLDYDNFNNAVNLAVSNYSGPGLLNWNSSTQTLSFTSNGQAMNALTINLPTVDDSMIEGNEAFQIILDNPGSTTGANSTGSASVTTNIIDTNNGGPVLDTASWNLTGSSLVNEGGVANYTISLSGILQANETAKVHLDLNDISTNSLDYDSFNNAVDLAVANYTGPGVLNWDTVAQILTFTSDGQTMGNLNISVSTIDDALVEGTEAFQIILDNPGSTTGANITGSSTLTTNIMDTNNGGPELDSANWSLTGSTSVNEGQAANYTVTLSGVLQSGETASVHLHLADLSTNSQDYSDFNTAITLAVSNYTGPGSLIWNSTTQILVFTSDGQAMGNLDISLLTVDDTLVEGTEAFQIVLDNPGSSTGSDITGSSSLTTNIIDVNNGSLGLDTTIWNMTGTSTVNEGQSANYAVTLTGVLQANETAHVHLSINNLSANAQDYGNFVDAVILAVNNYAGPGIINWNTTTQILSFTSDSQAMGSLNISLPTIDDDLVEGVEAFQIILNNPGSDTGANVTGSSTLTTNIIDTNNGGSGFDNAVWSLTGNASVNEGDNAIYTISLSGTLQNGETAFISLNIADLTTTSQDYGNFINAVTQAVTNYSGPGILNWNSTTQVLTFTGNGQAMSDLIINLPISNDVFVENTEAFQIIMDNPGSSTGAHVSGSTTHTTNILDSNNSALTAVWNMSGSASVNEGDVASYVVSLSNIMQLNETATVHLSISNLTTSNRDYESFSDAVALAVSNYTGPGQLSWNSTTQILTFTSDGQAMSNLIINLVTVDDMLVEGTEAFQITMDNPGSTTGANIVGNMILSTNIIDTDSGGPGLDSANWSLTGSTSVNESQTANYTITLSGVLQANETASIRLHLADLSTNSQDYGDFNTAIDLAVSNYTGPGSLSWNSTTQILIFTSDGQAMGNLNISLLTVDDTLVEGTEAFQIILDNPGSTTGSDISGSSSLTTNIIDVNNDGPSLDSATWNMTGTASVNEGQAANYIVTLTGVLQANETAQVHLTINNLSTNDQDYGNFVDAVTLAVSNYTGPGVLNWNTTTQILSFTSDGQSMGNINISLPTIDEALVEGNEAFQVILNNPGSNTGANVTGSTTLTTNIIDTNNGGPALDSVRWNMVGSTSVNEGANASYTISLAGILQANETATVHLNLTDLTTNSLDYSNFINAVSLAVSNYSGPGVLTWNSTTQILTFTSDGQGMADVTINLATVDDALSEGTEAFQVTLDNPGSTTGAHVTGSTTLTTNIVDTNNGGPGLDTINWNMTGSSSVNEGASATYTLNLSGILQNNETASVRLSLSDISTSAQDYANFINAVNLAVTNYSGSGTLNWNSSTQILTFTSNGQAMANLVINLDTIDDTLIEGTESYQIVLDNPGSTTGANVTGSANIITNIVDTNNGGPALDTSNWSLIGSSSVNEGQNAIYTLGLSGVLQANETASIHLTLNNVSTSFQDYGDFITAVSSAVSAYNGSGQLSWNSTTQILTFTSQGQAMTDLNIVLSTIDDVLVEGSESFRVNIDNPGSTTGANVTGNANVVTIIVDTNGGGPLLDTATWNMNGSLSVNEGQTASYTLSLSGILQGNETATVHLMMGDISTNSLDYNGFINAVTLAVNNYAGPGQLSWNSNNQILTFTSIGQSMSNLIINLETIDDSLVEGTESFQVIIDNPGSTTGANVTGSATVTTSIIDTNNGGPGIDTATWNLTGSTSVTEGQTANYTLSLAGVLQAGETANIHLNINNVSTNSQDYTNFIAAVTAAVSAYVGSGQLSWNSSTQILTFTSNGQVMTNLNINLSTVDDALIEGTETFQIIIDNPGSTTGANVVGSVIVNTNIVDNDLPTFVGSGASVLLSTTGTSVVPNFAGAYGLSLLNPIQGDLRGLINTLIGPGGILQGQTFENALAIILSQQGVFYDTDVVRLTDGGSSNSYHYDIAFNGSENFVNYHITPPSALFGVLSLSDQIAIMGYDITSIHDMGNGQLLFSTAAGGNLPVYNSSTGTYSSFDFDNEDVILATKQPGGYYTFQMFFNGSQAVNLDDSLLNLPGVLQEFIIDGLAYIGTVQNGTMYFSLSNLVDVNLVPLLGLNVPGAVLGDGGDIYSIQRVNGNWDLNSFNVYFSAQALGWSNELLENALVNVANLNVGTALANAINALIGSGQVARYFDINDFDIVNNTLYFSISSLLNVDLINLLASVITDPLDPLYALTLRGENIYSISRDNASSPWNKATLSLYLDGSAHGLGSSSGIIGNLTDNLVEDIDAFSFAHSDNNHNTILYATTGGGNEPQVGGSYDAQTLVAFNNGTFYDAFNLQELTNNAVSNNHITGVHVLENGTILFVLGTTATLPGSIVAHPNDIVSWNGLNFSLYFDGSLHGILDSSSIDSIYVFPSGTANSGKILMTLDSSASLPGAGVVENQDIIMFDPATNTYQMMVQGSSMGINDIGTEIIINTDLSAGINIGLLGNSENPGVFTSIINQVKSTVTTETTTLQNTINAINTELQPEGILNALLSGILNPILNLTNSILGNVNNLLTSLNLGLVDNLAASIGTLSTDLASLKTSLTNISPLNALTLSLQGVSVSGALTATNNAINFVNNTLIPIANSADIVSQGIDNLISSLNTQLAVGTTIDLSLYDIKIDGLHRLNNNDYLISFAQLLNPEIELNLNLNTGFLNNPALANLGLTVNTQNLINNLDGTIDTILSPVLNSYLVSDLVANALSPDLGLIGNNIYQLSQGIDGHWNFSLYFDGADHGLDNGTAVDTVLDYINSYYNDLTLGSLFDTGLLHLSSDEDIADFNVFELNSALVNGSVANDILVGTASNETFYSGLGEDIMTGNGGANTYLFDAASVNTNSVERDIINDFNPSHGDKIVFLNDIFGGGANPIQNQVHASTVNIDGVNSTLLTVTQPNTNVHVQEILLKNYSPEVLPQLTDFVQVA